MWDRSESGIEGYGIEARVGLWCLGLKRVGLGDAGSKREWDRGVWE
jgi:hypothetical protein